MANEIHSLNIGGTTYPIQPEYSTSAGKVNSSLKAGTKSYDGSSEVTITAADLGLSQAMLYIGTSTTEITDGGSQQPSIGGSNKTPSAGNVVIYNNNEFIWNGSVWEKLGDEMNHKVMQSPVSDPVADDATSTTFIDAISQDANGVITATKKKLPSYLPTSGGTMSGALTISTNGWNNQLVLNGIDSNAGIQFKYSNSLQGSLYCAQKELYWLKDSNAYSLIHSGNIGSYAMKHNSVSYQAAVNDCGFALTQNGWPYNGPFISFGHDASYKVVLHYPYGLSALKLKVFNNSTEGSDWKTIAFTDSDITGNAGSATKLQTARTIWGQSFDGTGDVKGGLTAVQNIDFESNNLHDIGSNSRQARFIYTGWLGSQTGKTLFFGANNGTHMVINSSGNVTIGDRDYAETSAKLYVSGITRIGGNTAINGTCSASSGFFETSDSRLKDFKDPVKVDLDKLSKLTKAYFTFKNDPEKMHLGVSAQEIQEIYPEIVNENEEGFLTVNYAKLSVIALSAIDELNNRLNSIEERLAKLEK